MSPAAGALDGRHAVVTGGGRGIGAAIATTLAAEGAQVTLMGRNETPAEGKGRNAPGRTGDLLRRDR
jgi:NAD(P)-dependent dehydrogenase (short-subunit alcohol dehydrogenase family)